MLGGGAANAVVFDVGNVLIEWDPRHLYRKLLPTSDAVEAFLASICTTDWNAQQDLGRKWADAIAERVERFPEHADLIKAYDARWMEMVPGAFDANVALMRDLKRAGTPVYGLTNFSSEKWALACERFSFLTEFEHVVVSAEVGLMKPDPRIFETLIERTGLSPQQTVFFDDLKANCDAADSLGFLAKQVVPGLDLRAELRAEGALA